MVSALEKSGMRIKSGRRAKIASGLPACTLPLTALACSVALEIPSSSTYLVRATMRLGSTKSSKISSVLMDKETMRSGFLVKETLVPVASVRV